MAMVRSTIYLPDVVLVLPERTQGFRFKGVAMAEFKALMRAKTDFENMPVIVSSPCGLTTTTDPTTHNQ